MLGLRIIALPADFKASMSGSNKSVAANCPASARWVSASKQAALRSALRSLHNSLPFKLCFCCFSFLPSSARMPLSRR
ncbi:hypothetical protein EYF80_029673 [Liparis tanakae]|uniref:Uncharacterized protein n=1 Tax=Liparis tanakae TaxID=230148 RepID=A0A4Z2H3D2_9TELE|nr:hypothetical protein EYF80_029673 [Liparis tanakae]